MQSTILDATRQLEFSGVHELDGMRWLFQSTSVSGWSFVGIKSGSGYSTRGLKTCTHEIPVPLTYRPVSRRHWQTFQKLFNDPLVQAMLPVPKDGKVGTGVYFLDVAKCPRYVEILAVLERMSSPMHRALRSWWSCRSSTLFKEMGYTNVHPLMIHNLRSVDVNETRQIASDALTRPRTVVLAGEDMILSQDVTVLETGLNDLALDDLIALPWEHIGANVVLNYCRYNRLDAEVQE